MNRDQINRADERQFFNETDLLHMNTFVDDTSQVIPEDKAENYKSYYIEKMKETVSKEVTIPPQSTKDVTIYESKLDKKVAVPLRQATRKRKVYLDSKFRDERIYSDASSFSGTFGRTFHNVISMRLTSMEFSNVQKVISSTSNKLYWRNIEDIDIDPPFPIYTAIIPPGSYTYTTFQTQAPQIQNIIKRHGGKQNADGTNAIFHYFIMDISLDTDLGNFTSIIAQPAPSNPITTISGSNEVVFQMPGHGFKTGDTIYVLGVRGIIGGINSSSFNGPWTITVVNSDSFTYSIFFVATGSVTGGGALVKAGELAPYQFMFGDYSDTCADVIGFRVENSNVDMGIVNPFTSKIIPITQVITGKRTSIVAVNHGLRPGDTVFINNVIVQPSFANEGNIFKVLFVPSPDVIIIDFYTEFLTSISGSFLGTKLFQVNFPNHGFNNIIDIEQTGTNLVTITSLIPHGLTSGSSIRISGTNCVPNIDGYYTNLTVIDIDQFQLSNPVNPLTPEILPITITFSGNSGILLADHVVHFYNATAFGGFVDTDINGKEFVIRKVIDSNNFIVEGLYGFSMVSETGGGSDVRFNSLLHGWRGVQTNSPGGTLNKPVALSGDNYCFLTCPGLKYDNVASNGPVQNIFAKLFITSNPGVIIFNEYDASDLEFITPIEKLSSILFEIRDTFGNLLSFSGLDYSFSIELTELHQIDANNNVNKFNETYSIAAG